MCRRVVTCNLLRRLPKYWRPPMIKKIFFFISQQSKEKVQFQDFLAEKQAPLPIFYHIIVFLTFFTRYIFFTEKRMYFEVYPCVSASIVLK